MKILHFSDIHAGLFPNGVTWLFDKRALGTATQHIRRKHKQDFSTLTRLADHITNIRPDLIVYTGDLTATAQPGEFKLALQLLKPSVANSHVPVIAIPGNHDAYVNRQDALQARQDAIASLNTFDCPKDMQDASRNLDTLPCNAPLRRIVHGSIAFHILDAAHPMPPWMSGGKTSQTQIDALEQQLKQTKSNDRLNILVSHFPIFMKNGNRLNWRRRIDCDQRLRALADDKLVDMLLCGHIHTPFTFAHEQFTQVCPGSITLHHHFAVIDINEKTQHVQTSLLDVNIL